MEQQENKEMQQTPDSGLTLEAAFRELDSLTEKMQSEELSLEESFALYKRGLELVELCSRKIEKVECDIRKLNPDRV